MRQRIRTSIIVGVCMLTVSCVKSDVPSDRAAPVDAETAAVVVLSDSLFAVVKARNDTACLRTATRSPRLADSVLVIIPNEKRAVLARVAERLASCPGDEAEPGFAYYRLTAFGFETADLGIAVLATTAFPKGGSRTDIDGNGTPEDYRACTSAEGVHLTVWAGEALRSRRVWHHYHYLGYDVEPNCVEADFRED